MSIKKPVTIGGVQYDSIAHAADTLDVTTTTAKRWAVKGRPAVDGRTLRGKPVRVRGVEYPSIRSAADAHGVVHSAVYYWIKIGVAERVE